MVLEPIRGDHSDPLNYRSGGWKRWTDVDILCNSVRTSIGLCDGLTLLCGAHVSCIKHRVDYKPLNCHALDCVRNIQDFGVVTADTGRGISSDVASGGGWWQGGGEHDNR